VTISPRRLQKRERVMVAGVNARRASDTTAPSPTRPERDPSDLGDRRRWASFLTWAFFLAEMAGRDGILPTSAHAGDEGLGRADHPSGETAPIANNLPNISVSTATDAPEPITYQHAPTMPAYAPTPLSSELGEAKIAPIADGVAHGGAAGGGGSGHPMSADDASPTPEASDGAFVAFNTSGELLDLGLSHDMNDTAQGLLSGLSDVLSSLPLVGGLLGNLDDTLVHATDHLLPALSPATSLIGLDGGHEGAGVGSPGQINFSFGAPSDSPTLVSDSNGYTNYGIALSLGGSDAGTSTSETPVDTDLTSGLDAWAFNQIPGADHDSSDALHIDQAVMRTASDILA
jgi:hypothetical protein